MRGITTTLLLGGLARPAVAQGIGAGPHMPMGGWFGMVIGVILLAAIILVLLALAKRLSGDATPTAGRDPLDILKERLARGEIDIDEYEARRRALER